MDNATRKELLYKARAAGYPGSILDVFANYDQGRDLIGEFQQQQQMQQTQQMSDMAAQQVGMQQAPQQQPQQQMQPQMPVVPSSPTPAPNFTPPQPPAPIGVQSQDTPVGIVSGQSGPNQGRAIFATGGFTNEGPGCPDGYFKDNNGNCVEILPQSDFRGKEYFENFRTKEQRDKCLEFPGSEGCFKDKKAALQNKELPGYVREQLEYLTDLHPDTHPEYKYIASDSVTGLTALKTLEQKPLTVKEYDDITGGYGTKILTGEVKNETATKIAEMLDKGEYIKNLYSNYNKNKLAQITDPRTGKLLPTNDPRAQIDLRETMWKQQPTKENSKEGSIDERRQALGYPTNMGENDLFFNRSEGVGELPMRAVKTGIAGLIEDKWIVDKNGRGTLNPNYRGKLDENGKEWVEKAVSKYGLDPAVIGYFNQSAMSDSKKTLADYDPSLLLPSERYSKQPTIVVGEIGNQLTWSTRKGDIMPNKNVADYEGAPRVVGATNMSGVDIPKKKKATGGFSGEGPGCPEGQFKDVNGNCVPLMKPSEFRGNEYYAEGDSEGGSFAKSPGCFNYDCGEAGYKEYPKYAANNITNYGQRLGIGKDNYSASYVTSKTDEELINQQLDITDPKAKTVAYPGVEGAFTTVTTETAAERAQRAKTIDAAKIREKARRDDQDSFAYDVTNFAKFNKYGEQKPLTFEEFNDLTGGYAHEYLFESDASEKNKKAIVATIEPKSYEAYLANALAFKPQKEQLLKKNVADEEGGLRVFGENITGNSEITIKKDKPYSKLSEEERTQADEAEEIKQMERDNYYREAKTRSIKQQQALRENKKLGGAKCYTCVGRKRRV